MSGCIYEKRLILKYINENGTDPMNNQALNPEQLFEIKSKLNILTLIVTKIFIIKNQI